MTLSERPDPFWKEHLPRLEQQYLEALPKYRPKRFARFLAMPMLFALAACFVPLREASTAPVLKNTVAQEATEELEELLTALEETPVLEEEEQKQLKEEIERLSEESEKTPLTSEKWEIVDALRERMQIRLENADVTMSKGLEAAAELERAEIDGKQLSLKRKEQLEKKLAEALSKLGKNGDFSDAPAGMREKLQQLMKNGKLSFSKDPGKRQQQLSDLQEFLHNEQKKLSEIRKKCKACQKGSCKGGQCKDGQCQSGFCNGQGQKAGQGSGSQQGNRPGRGGISRGPGTAPITWGRESEEQGIKFKETVLPEGFLEQPKDELVGLEASAPEVEPAATAARGKARARSAAAGGTTTNRRLSPKHRRAVRKYFSDESP